MRFLAVEKLGEHKYKTPEGYLICIDAILSRTGKQEYKRSELFGDSCDDSENIVYVDRTDDEVFSEQSLASFENKPICLEHPDEDVNVDNHNKLSVGFVRDIHKGVDNGQPVMMGTLVFTDKTAIELIENGEYKELSCGYDCDIADEKELIQRNIRGNHVALCKQGRAGIARIVDSVDYKIKETYSYNGHYYKLTDIDKNKNNEKIYEFEDMNGRRIYINEKDVYKFKLVDSPDNMSKSGQQQIYEHEIQVALDKANVPNKLWNKHGNKFTIDNNKIVLIATENGVNCKANDDMKKYKNSTEIANFITKHLNDSVNDIQATRKSGQDKIIYVMQSDVDNDLYFYIGKKYAMKEGNFGYTKFEMGSDTPEKIKAELAKSGWHQVQKGKASIIDYEWVNVEEENYKKANEELMKDKQIIRSSSGEIHVFKNRGKYEVDAYNRNNLDNNALQQITNKFGVNLRHGNYGYITIISANKDAIYKAFAAINPTYGVGSWQIEDEITKDSKQQLFTVEYEKDGITHVEKIRANSVKDVIKKVKKQ